MRRKAEKIFTLVTPNHPNEELRRLTDYDPAGPRRNNRAVHRRPKYQLLEEVDQPP